MRFQVRAHVGVILNDQNGRRIGRWISRHGFEGPGIFLRPSGERRRGCLGWRLPAFVFDQILGRQMPFAQ